MLATVLKAAWSRLCIALSRPGVPPGRARSVYIALTPELPIIWPRNETPGEEDDNDR